MIGRSVALRVFLVVVVALIGLGLFLFSATKNELSFDASEGSSRASEALMGEEEPLDSNADIKKQAPLASPPAVIKAIYATAWSAGSEKKTAYFLDLFKNTEINAIVLDVKDYTGVVSYEPDVEMVRSIGAFENRIGKINKLIKLLHDNGVYVIARISTFQDGALARARPDLAVSSKASGLQWKDRNGLMWTNPTSKEVWDYNIAVARDAFDRGFDEVNFDYIRFPSDGNLGDLSFSGYDGSVARDKMIARFFRYLRSELEGHKISADLFGEVAYVRGDNGLGQNLKLALANFDFIAPMTYPSHYHPNFRGMENAALEPYEVLKYSMDQAFLQLIEAWQAVQPIDVILSEEKDMGEDSSPVAQNDGISQPLVPVDADLQSMFKVKFRPWLQDFDLGAVYTADMVRAQMRGVHDAGFVGYSGLDAEEFKNGWMLWNPSNNYTRAALLAN